MKGRAEKEFAKLLNEVMAKKNWSTTMMMIEANNLSSDGNEIFGLRALQNWLAGKCLPSPAAVKAIAFAANEPALMGKLYEVIELSKKVKKTDRAATLTVHTGTKENKSTDIVSRRCG